MMRTPADPGIQVIPGPRRSRPRVCVIGGGIAGLSAAHNVLANAKHPIDVTVLEASDALGGKLRVSEIADVPVDEGAEAVQATRPEAVALARAVGLDRDLVHPEVFGASLWIGNELLKMPPTVMGIPTDLRALTASKVLPLNTILKMPLEYHKTATRFDNDVSVGAFVEERLGREVVDTLVEPVLGGVYAGRADALSLEATVPALFRELRNQRSLLKAAEFTSRGGGRQAGARRGPVFAGIRGGVGRLPAAIADDLVSLGADVRRNAPVRSIHRLADHWRVIVGTPDNQEVLEAEEIILAVPPQQASDLLAHICPPAANDLGLIDMSSMATVAMAYPAKAVGPMRGSGFLVPPSEQRTIKAANYASRKWDWVSRRAKTRRGESDSMVMLRASVGRLGEEEVLSLDDKEIAARVHDDLQAAIGISELPLQYRVTRWNDAIPQYSTGHVRRVERIRAAVSGVPGLEVCGAAFDGVGVAAVIGSANFAARAVSDRLAAHALVLD
ncbi:MAG: protoporphyrinogen oxidase [Actinomycetia bacterium]|nr:protoporphyrinogen oxidase [Actinomycetes bacterium]